MSGSLTLDNSGIMSVLKLPTDGVTLEWLADFGFAKNLAAWGFVVVESSPFPRPRRAR